MTKRVILLVSIGFFSFVSLSYLIYSGNKPKKLFENIKIPASYNKKEAEEAIKRAEFENMMLRSPRTGKIPDGIRANELAFSSKIPTTEAYSLFKGNNAQYSSNWVFRGPINQGGRTRALSFDAANANIILAGGISGGMWRSTDQGKNWKKTTALADIQSVTCLAQDERAGKTNTWYYGTGESRGNSAEGGGNAPYRGDGIFKSTDNGLSWSRLAATVKNQPQKFNQFSYVWNIVTDPVSTQDVVYASTNRAVLRSTDGGTTWNEVLGSFQNNFSEYTDVAIASNGVVYAAFSDEGSTKGIFRSSNGTDWKEITPTGFSGLFKRIVIGTSQSKQEVVYFLAHTPFKGATQHSLWKYTDDGNGTGTWSDRSANIPAFGGYENVGNFDSQQSYDLLIKVKPDNPDVVFIGGTNLYRSLDGFATPITNSGWIGGYKNDASGFENYANHHSDQHSLSFSPANSSVLVSGMDGGISITKDCLSGNLVWESISNGYTTSQFYSVAIDQATSGNYMMIGGLQDNGHLGTFTGNAAEPWIVLPFGGDGCFTAMSNGIGLGTGALYISTQNGNVKRITLKNGTNDSWTSVTPVGASNFLFVTPYILDPNNDIIMYLAAGDSVWRNSDLSGIPAYLQEKTDVNWQRLSNSGVSSGVVSALAASKNPANVLYYGSSGGEIYRMVNANSGDPKPIDVWTGKGLPQGAYVSCIAVDPNDAGIAMAVFSNYEVISLYYTNDGGNSWTPVAGNLEENPDGSGSGPSCRWATILPYNGKTYYFVATSTGVYSTSELNGASTVWIKEAASQIGNSVVTMLVSRPADGVVVAATHAGGIFSANVSVTGVKDNSNLVSSFKLAQNYPNPFNPSTTINYRIAVNSDVTLKVYDQLGKEVAALVNGYKPAGSYSVNFNASKLASGVYYYTLKTGSFVETKKLTLLK